MKDPSVLGSALGSILIIRFLHALGLFEVADDTTFVDVALFVFSMSFFFVERMRFINPLGYEVLPLI